GGKRRRMHTVPSPPPEGCPIGGMTPPRASARSAPSSVLLTRARHRARSKAWSRCRRSVAAAGRRKARTERAPPGVSALQLEPSAIDLDSPAGDRQPEASAAQLARTPPIDAVEPIEHAVAVLGGNAGPGVGDLHPRALSSIEHDDATLTALRIVPDGVVHEIHQRLPEQHAVDSHHDGPGTLD